MARQPLAALVLLVVVCPGWAMADLVLVEPGRATVVDFSAFTGAGFAPNPAPGQLDSNTWRVGGFTDGTLSYGGTGVTGDFARGQSSGGVTSGGLYAFQVATGDWALGVQATGTDFNPGFVELRIRNQMGLAAATWRVGYDLYCRNDQGRSSSWDVAYSLDGSSFVNLPELRYTSPGAASANPGFVSMPLESSIAVSVPDQGNLFLRWTSADFAGTGSRDEFALDNISVSATATPEPSTCVLASVATILFGTYHWRRKALAQRHRGGGEHGANALVSEGRRFVCTARGTKNGDA
jgi:hypothetical protein